MKSLRVIAIEGAKAIGKTTTALQHARTAYPLDDPDQLAVARADQRRLLQGDRPVLIDEWQRLPSVWDLARAPIFAGCRARLAERSSTAT